MLLYYITKNGYQFQILKLTNERSVVITYNPYSVLYNPMCNYILVSRSFYLMSTTPYVCGTKLTTNKMSRKSC